MSHITSDLEYFMCDVCHVYVHKDIFCPHRRECKGLDSKELKKDECAAIEKVINAEERVRLQSSDADVQRVVDKGNVPLSKRERQQEMRTRLKVADEWQAKEMKKHEVDKGEMKELLDFLDE